MSAAEVDAPRKGARGPALGHASQEAHAPALRFRAPCDSVLAAVGNTPGIR